VSGGLPASSAPLTSVADVISRMAAIGASLEAEDGVACFNRMYLEVTEQVDSNLRAGFFADPVFMTQLDITFAGLYFAAVDAADHGAAVPLAWRPLFDQRSAPGIEPIQFALAGMNAHINHDLPLAVTGTCSMLGTSPGAGTHQADYQKVDRLLDAAEQSVRQSFESAPELAADRHLQAVGNLIGAWSINSARDLAWINSLLLWQVRDVPVARGLLRDSLAATTAAASRTLLTEV
jgi:Family of unknown function (DUF5995)